MRNAVIGQDAIQVTVPAPAGERMFDWSAVRCRLLWYIFKTPLNLRGIFPTVNLVIWHLLRGGVRIEMGDLRMAATAGSWMVIVHGPGRRLQEFTPDAYICSLHLALETGSADWTGPPAAVLRDEAGLRDAAGALGKLVYRQHKNGLDPGGEVFCTRSFREEIEVQRHVWLFLEQLVPLLRAAGIELREPDLSDPRVATSMGMIDRWPLNLPLHRGQIARSACVSPSQLDRIWREIRHQTPFQYWDLRRIRFARSRLENTNDSIKQIAFDLGFAHLAQFSNWFHAHQSMSPRAYRSGFRG